MAFTVAPMPPPFLGAGGRNSQPLESTTPSRVNVEGGSGSPTPGAHGPRGVRSAARGLEAAGCRDLKWCPCRGLGVGAGNWARPERSLHPAWARVSVRARTGLNLEPRAAARLPIPLRSRESLRSPCGEEAALRREGGKEVGVGTDPGWRAATLAETVPSPLFPRLPYSGIVLGREVRRGSSLRAWPGGGPSFPSHAGEN